MYKCIVLRVVSLSALFAKPCVENGVMVSLLTNIILVGRCNEKLLAKEVQLIRKVFSLFLKENSKGPILQKADKENSLSISFIIIITMHFHVHVGFRLRNKYELSSFAILQSPSTQSINTFLDRLWVAFDILGHFGVHSVVPR